MDALPLPRSDSLSASSVPKSSSTSTSEQREPIGARGTEGLSSSNGRTEPSAIALPPGASPVLGRSSIPSRTSLLKGKEAQRPSLAATLPEDIVYLMMRCADPDAFSSMSLVSRSWYKASQSPQLLALQLSRCPLLVEPFQPEDLDLSDEDIPALRKELNTQGRRSLFSAFTRPSRVNIKLISNSTSSTAALPNGESFRFIFSPQGRLLLALTSTRIHLLDLTSKSISVKLELKTKRRPLAAAILDDGSRLAILNTMLKINIYDLTEERPSLIRTIVLDKAPRTITLAPGAALLAAAYDTGVELYSLTNRDAVTERRVVKCDAVDHLRFSADGTMLMGTTTESKPPSTFILSCPYFNDMGSGVPPEHLLSFMWTTQIIFPTSSHDNSHGTLLHQGGSEGLNWAFTHDRVYECFRGVRTHDLRNGTNYFVAPSTDTHATLPLPCTLPNADDSGHLVAAGLSMKEVWVYGVPPDLEYAMTSQVEATNRAVLQASSAHPRAGDAEMLRRTSILKTGELGYVRRPQWQVLVDRHSNRFIQGRRVADVPGLSAVQWVPLDTNDPLDFGARLVAVATNNTTVSSAEAEAEGGLTADSGRIVVLDFERSTRNGKHFSETLELGGSDFVELEEEEMDHDTEVILARRRTIAERIEAERQSAIQLDRDRSADRRTRAEAEDVPIMPMYRGEKAEHQRAPLQSSNAGPSNRRESFEDGPSLEEAEAMAGPFSLGGPRSRNLIGTVAAVRHPEPPPLPPSGQVRYRRAETGDVPRTPRQVPHESDADNWVPPPPPYSKDAQEPLPDHLLDTLRSSRSLSDLSRRSSGANYPIPVTRNRTSANLTRGPSTRSALSSTVASASIQSGRARSRSPPIRGRSLVTTPETARSLAEDGADTDSNDEEIAGARATPHRRTDSLPVSHTFSEDPEVRNQTRPNGPAVGRSRGAARQRNMPPVPELAAAGSPDRAASESPLMSATITDLSSTTHPYDLGLDLTPPLTASEMSAVQSRPGSMVGRRLTREPQEMEDGAIPPMPPIPPSVLPLVQTAVSPVTHFHESPLGISNLAPGIPGNPPPTPIEHISALARRTSTGPDGIGGSQLNRNSSLVGSREISMDRRSQSLSLKKPTVKAGSSALRAPASPVMHGNGSSRYSATESQMAAAREAHVRNTAAMSQPMVDRVPTGRRRKNVESNDDEDSHRQQRATPGRMETIPSVPSREASVMSHVNRKPKTRSRSRSRHRDENREDRVPDQLPSMFAPSTLRGPMIRDGADGNPTPAGNNPRVGSPRIGSLSTARAWISSSLNSGTPKSPHTPSITPRSGSMPSVFSHRQQNLDRIERDDNYPGPVRSATMQMYGSAHTGPTGGGPPQAPIDSLPSRSRSRPDVDDDGVSRPSMSASQHTTAASTGISNSRPTPTPPPGASSLHNHSTPVSRPDSRPDSASKREQDRVENGSGSGGGGSSGEKVASKVRTWAAKRQERDRALYGIEGAHGAEDEEDVGPNLAGLSAALTPRIGTVKRKGFGVVGRGRIGKSRVDKGKEREVLGMGAGDGDDDDDDDDAGERAGGIMGHTRRGSGLGIAFASRKPSRAGTNKSRDRRGGDGSGGGGSSLRRFGARCSIM